MKDAETKKARAYRRRCLNAAVIILLLFTPILVFMFLMSQPARISRKIILDASAKQLNKSPNELTEEDFEQIYKLDLSNKQLCDLKLLAKFTNLQDLTLSGVIFIDIPGWKKVLSRLGIYEIDEKVTLDLRPLEKLSNLQTLSIYYIHVKNVKPLASNTNLKHLYLIGIPANDINSINNLTKLSRLYIHDCANITNAQISDLQSALPKLKIYR